MADFQCQKTKTNYENDFKNDLRLCFIYFIVISTSGLV